MCAEIVKTEMESVAEDAAGSTSPTTAKSKPIALLGNRQEVRMELSDKAQVVLGLSTRMLNGHIVVDGCELIPDERTRKLVPWSIPTKIGEAREVVETFDVDTLAKLESLHQGNTSALDQAEIDLLETATLAEENQAIRACVCDAAMDLLHDVLNKSTMEVVSGVRVWCPPEDFDEKLAAYQAFVTESIT